MRRISSAAARRLDGLPIRRSRKPSGPSLRNRSRQRRNVRSDTPSISAASSCDSSPRSCRSSNLETHLPYPLQHLRPDHSPPPFRAVLKPDRYRATKTGQITSQPHHAEERLEPEPGMRQPPWRRYRVLEPQLHSTVQNTTNMVLRNIGFRSVNTDDVISKRVAPNTDGPCTGTSLRDLLRVADLARTRRSAPWIRREHAVES